MAIPNQAPPATHHLGTTVEDITTSIDLIDFPFIADMMNGLYSDSIGACLREYPTNGWDSHVEAGVTRPVEVTLPTAFSPQLVIQDFGLGLSIDDLRNVYSKYGRSLKRESNNVAGQLGMGCKSALSYAPSFTINAVKNGVRVIAIFTKDEAGLGVIKVLDTVGTNDPNGVTITIPVDNGDIAAFAETASEIFSFWNPDHILVNGSRPDSPGWLDAALWLDTEKMTCLVRNDALDSSYVVMGNVAYPVPDAARQNKNGTSTRRRFVARLNIGDVDFVPSREDVKQTSHTKKTLSELNDYIFTAFDRAFGKALEQVTTPWEETKLRVTWGAGDLTLRSHGGTMWEYNPTSYRRRRQTSAQYEYNLARIVNSPDLIIVTGFTAQTLSSAARSRIREFASGSLYLILTKGVTGIGKLEGRSNVYKYADIVAATKPERRQRNADGTRAPKVETRYTMYGSKTFSSLTAKEIATLAEDTDNTVLYLPAGHYFPSYNALLDGSTFVVALYSSAQLPRILRFVPGMRSCEHEMTARREAATKAITEKDKQMYKARKTVTAQLRNIDPSKVTDPELRHFLELAKDPFSDTLEAAIAHSVSIPEPAHRFREVQSLTKEYSLLSQMYNSADPTDVLLYLNAKFEVIRQERAEKAVAKAAAAALAAANLTDSLADLVAA